MWSKDRHHRIIAMLATREQVSLENLSEAFGVSRETLRRDIVQLEAEGRLKRVHGGFTRVGDAEPPFQSRVTANAEAKQRIGAAAARLVQPGMLIAVEAGTTTQAFAEHLTGIPKLQVVTNALNVATTLQGMGNQVELILLGGRLGADVPGTYGEITIAQLRRFRPQLAFMSPVALGPRGAMNYDLAEAEVARTMAEIAERLIVLADHTKLGKQSRIQVCGCDAIDTVVTNRKAKPAHLSELEASGVRELIRA